MPFLIYLKFCPPPLTIIIWEGINLWFSVSWGTSLTLRNCCWWAARRLPVLWELLSVKSEQDRKKSGRTEVLLTPTIILEAKIAMHFITVDFFLQKNIFKLADNIIAQMFSSLLPAPYLSLSVWWSWYGNVWFRRLSLTLRNPNAQIIITVGHRELSD